MVVNKTTAFLLKNYSISSILLFIATGSAFLNHLNILDLSFEGENILTECLYLVFYNINRLSH